MFFEFFRARNPPFKGRTELCFLQLTRTCPFENRPFESERHCSLVKLVLFPKHYDTHYFSGSKAVGFRDFCHFRLELDWDRNVRCRYCL